MSKDERPERLSKIAEADEIYVLESHKGSRTLDRLPRKRVERVTKRAISNEQMCIRVARDRSGQTIDAVTGKGALSKQRLLNAPLQKGSVHINVNAYHSRTRSWPVPFRGIADRYLSHYFGSRWALDGQRIASRNAFPRAALGRLNT